MIYIYNTLIPGIMGQIGKCGLNRTEGMGFLAVLVKNRTSISPNLVLNKVWLCTDSGLELGVLFLEEAILTNQCI